MQTNTEALNPLFSIQAMVQEINTVQKKKTVPALESIAKNIGATVKDGVQNVSKKFFDISKAFANNYLKLDKSRTRIHIEFLKEIKSIEDVKKLNLTLWNILQLVRMKPEQFQKTSDFLKGLIETLNKLAGKSFKVALGITALAGAFMLFGFVNLVAVTKAVIALKLLSMAVGSFIMSIVKAFKTVGIIKTFFILKNIPDILHEMGFAVAAISLGLYLVNKVNWNSVAKLTLSIVALGISVRFISEKGKFSTAFLIITLSFALLSMAGSLKKFGEVAWSTIGKFPLFIASLGLTFRLWTKTKLGLLTTLSFSLFLISLSLFELKKVSWSSAMILPPFIAGLALSFRLFNKGITPLQMIAFSFAFMLFTFSFDMLTDIDVQAVWVVAGAIVGIGVALKFLLKGGASSSFGVNVEGNYISVIAKSIISLALGVGVLVYIFSTASWQSIVAGFTVLTGLLLTLGFVLKKLDGTNGSFTFNRNTSIQRMGGKKQTPPILRFALGLAILLLTIDAFNELSWNGALQVIMFIVALSTVFIILDKLSKGGKPRAPQGLFGFSIGLAILLLTIDAFNEINWVPAFRLLIFVGLLGLTLRLFPKQVGSGLFTFSLSLLMIQGLLWLISNTNYNETNLQLYFTSLIGLVVIGGIIGKTLFGAIMKGSIALFAMSIPLLIITHALNKIGKNFNLQAFQNTLMFTGAIGILGAVFALASVLMTPIIIGSIAVIALAVTTIIAAESLVLMNNINLNTENLSKFIEGIKILSLGLFSVFGYALIAIIPALAMIPVSIAMLTTAGLFALISYIPISNDKITSFTESIKILLNGLTNLSIIQLGEAIIKAGMMIPISLSMLLSAGTIALISKIPVNVPNIYKFGQGLKQIIDRINDLGFWDLGKTAAKSLLLLPISSTALLSALALKGISELTIKPEQMDNFGESLKILIRKIAESFEENKKILSSDGFVNGLKTITTLVSTIGAVPKIFTDIANMQFNEYEVKDGKLVLTKTSKFTPEMMKTVGQNLYMMLSALSETISNVATKLAANGQANLAASLLLKSINDSISPIVSTFKTISEVGYLSNPDEARKTVDALKLFTDEYITVFGKFGSKEAKDNSYVATATAWNMGQFFYNIKKFWDLKAIQLPTDYLMKFVDNLADSQKWQKVSKNLKELRDSFWSMSKAINSINFEKATQLNNLMYKLTDRNNAYTLQQILEELKELIGLVYKKQSISTGDGNSNNSLNTQPINNTTNNSTIINPKSSEKTNDKRTAESLLQSILDYLEGMNIPVIPNVQKVFVTNNQSNAGY